MAIINIYKWIYGSLVNRRNNVILGYTDGYSDITKQVRRILDNPPVLSPNYATVIWKHYGRIDRYIFIHLQGSHFIAFGKRGPYRATFELNRKDLLGLTKDYLPLGSVTEKIPRILPEYSLEAIKMSLEEDVNVKKTAPTSQSEALAAVILQAIVDQKRLCISVGPLGTSCKDNGVLDTDYFKAMVAAIESLPQKIAQYVSFGVCVDNNHARFLDDVMVMFYSDEKPFTVPSDAKNLSWNEIIAKPATLNKTAFDKLVKLLPGNDSPLLSLAEMMQKLSDGYKNYETVCRKDARKVKGPEWDIWLLAHSLQEIAPKSWDDFSAISGTMSQKLKEEFTSVSCQASLNWPLNERLMASLLDHMGYTPEDKKKLQKRALPDYLDSECQKYAFLYDENFNFAEVLNCKYLQQLGLDKQSDIDKWYNIFKKNKCLDSAAKKEFLKLYKGVKIETFKQAVEMLAMLNGEGLGELTLRDLKLELTGIDKYSELPALTQKLGSKLTDKQNQEIGKYIRELAIGFINDHGDLKLLEELVSPRTEQKEYVLNCLEADETGLLKQIFDKAKKSGFVESCEKMLLFRENLGSKHKDLRDRIYSIVVEAIKDNYLDQFNEKRIDKICNDFFVADKNSGKLKFPKAYSLLRNLLKDIAENADGEQLKKMVELIVSKENKTFAAIVYNTLKKRNSEGDAEPSVVVESCLASLNEKFEGLDKVSGNFPGVGGFKGKLAAFFSSQTNIWRVISGILLLIIFALLIYINSIISRSENNVSTQTTGELIASDTIDTTKDSVNVMLRLAEHMNDTVAVQLKDTLLVVDMYDGMLLSELWEIDSLYLKDKAGVFIDSLEDVLIEKGEIIDSEWVSQKMTRTIKIKENEPLLKTVFQDCLRINSFFSDRKITLNDSRMENNTYFAKYYLQTIKAINDSITNGKNKIAY